MSRQPRKPSSDDLDILTAAAAWRVALAEADQETSRDFETWLAADPRHAAAWRQVQAPWDHVAEHATAPEAMAAREEALQRARRQQRRRLTGRPLPWRSLAAGLAAVFLLSIGGTAAVLDRPTVYQTQLGERRVLTLADGSHVALDSGTLLKVRLRRHARDLQLLRGQARFDVAHDTSRPFSVRARDQVVLATGTSFNVDLLGGKVLITLIEGRVTVLKQPPEPRLPLVSRPPEIVLARMTPGQLLASPSGETEIPSSDASPPTLTSGANLDRATAWETGQLIFEDEPLGAVAERVGRYGQTPIVAEGRAAGLKISGIFNAGDASTFLDAVQSGLPVRADREEGGRIVLRIVGE